jgi:DNA-binding transcriptional LysR family regulator
MIERDIAEGALMELEIEDMPPDGMVLTISAAWRTDAPPGPAGRWFVDRIKSVTAQCPEDR